MHQQKIQNPPVKPLAGLAAVAVILAVLAADLLLSRLLARALGEAAGAVIFWALGLGVALLSLRRFVLSYSYIMSGQLIRVSFAYGRYERVMSDLYFANLLYLGTPAQAKERFPGARVNRAALKRCPLETVAAVYRDGGKPAVYLLQPDDEIRARLEETFRRARRKG